jgi:hypothetical protein
MRNASHRQRFYVLDLNNANSTPHYSHVARYKYTLH